MASDVASLAPDLIFDQLRATDELSKVIQVSGRVMLPEVVASVAVHTIRDLECHLKELPSLKMAARNVMSLMSKLGCIHWLLNHLYAIEPLFWNEETLRLLAYRIEDVLETFVVDVAVMLQKDEWRFIKRFLRKTILLLTDIFVLRNTRANIWNVRLEISCLLAFFPIGTIGSIRDEPLVASQGHRRFRQSCPRGTEEHFVGMTDELEKLVSLVLERKNRVISIWGEASLGKTTIAAKIYKHPEVRKGFRAFAWVCFSGGCDISTLLLNILRQLSRRPVNETTQNKVLKEVQREKNLIVLDNIQDIDQWRQLSPVLQIEGGKSVFLFTTREKSIAEEGYAHELRRLNEDEAWDLLKKHAFPGRDGPDMGLFPRLGREMVQKCEYLPSRISRLGTILSSKNSSDHWQVVNDRISEYIPGHQTEEDKQPETSLDMNYRNLPYYLKQCFLYLGNFSNLEDINVEDLYFLWIAEGMVSSVNEVKTNMRPDLANEEETTLGIASMDLEKILKQDIANENREEEGTLGIAEKYLTEFASKEMVWVQQEELSPTRRSQSCVLRSRAQELSSWEQEKEGFRLEIIDICNGKPNISGSSLSEETRRLGVHFDKLAHSEDIKLPSMDKLRSLFLFNSGKKSFESTLKILDFGKFKLLRVLNFVRCKFDGRKLPTGIHKLFNLRYLGLLYCDLDELPSSISNLRNLHVLNIRVLEKYHLGIPNVLCKLVLLNHLRLPYCTDREQTEKLSLGGMLKLETLFGFNSLIHDVCTLSNLKKLRHLGAHAYSNDSLKSLVKFIILHGARIRTNICIENKCDFTSKEGVAVLEEVLMCPNLYALTLSMVLIYKVPDCGNRVSSDLTELKLIGCKIKEDPMEVLWKFPKLQKLCLGHGAFVGREMTVQANGFPNLEYLEIRSLPYFEEWSLAKGAMHNLSELIIRRCPRLKMVPDGLRSISKLKNMEIELAPEAFINVSEKEYLRKFDFVPSVKIRLVNPCSTSEQ